MQMMEQPQKKTKKPIIFAGKDYLRFITDTVILAQQAMMFREYVQWVRLLMQLHSWTKSYQITPELESTLKQLLAKAYALENTHVKNNEQLYRSKCLQLEKEIFDIEMKISSSLQSLLLQTAEDDDDDIDAEFIAKMMKQSGMG